MKTKKMRQTLTVVERPTTLISEPCQKQREAAVPGRGRLGVSWDRGFMMLLLVTLTLMIPCTWAQGFLGGPFTRPPQVGDKPIVANGIVYYLKHIPLHCQEPYVTTYPFGGIVHGKRALLERDNPHIIYGNIEIPSNACLWIEPGSVLRFGPGFGIIVNGTLIARVSC